MPKNNGRVLFKIDYFHDNLLLNIQIYNIKLKSSKIIITNDA